MIKNVCMILCIFCLFAAFPLFAQTADWMEELLETNAVSYDQAARFVLEAADKPAEQAFAYAMEEAWLPKNAQADADARLAGLALLLMRSFDMDGGLLYSWFKNPHYAYRELAYKGVIQGKADPEMAVSGETLLFLVNRVFSLLEQQE